MNRADVESRWLAIVGKAISELVHQFRDSPGSFLYESDLRGLLYAKLYTALESEPISWTNPGPAWSEVRKGGPLRVNPARTEYPSRVRFDVALLPPELSQEKNAWCQPVRVAMELKLLQVDGTGNPFHGDVEYLVEYFNQHASSGGFSGISLVFFHRATDERLAEWLTSPVAGVSLQLNPAAHEPPSNGVVAWAFTPGA